ncbi:protein NO VEIN-like isoform X2 [Gigantopelta aegis]|uniref:protein NO VEIN-like isoform X2 n=1 Tax=Gigantopelta aegis TaxID=1735272 RepID=UPI001B887FE7|nr:protein NO VEIN-like isoform X2 [Gigantopelta aegis]
MSRREIEANRRKLRNVFENILKENPHGILKQRVWEIASQKLHKPVSSRDYGIKKMLQMFDEFSDLFVEEERDGKTYLVPGSPEYIVVSSISDESEDSDMESAISEKLTSLLQNKPSASMPPPSMTSSVPKNISPKKGLNDWQSSRTQRQVDKLKQLKNNLVKLLKAESGAISKKKIWNVYNKRFLNPKMSDYGINKMDEVFAFFNDVIKQDGDMIVLKQATGSASKGAAKPAPKPSAGLQWGQGVGGNDKWGGGGGAAATAAGDPFRNRKSTKQSFVPLSSSSDSLDSIDDYPNISRAPSRPRERDLSAQSRGSRDSSLSSRDPEDTMHADMRHEMRPEVNVATHVYGGLVDRVGGPADRVGGPADRFGGPADRFGGPADRFGGPADRFGGPADRVGGPADRAGGLAGTAQGGGLAGAAQGGGSTGIQGGVPLRPTIALPPQPLMNLHFPPLMMGSYSQLRGLNPMGQPLVFLGSKTMVPPASTRGADSVAPPSSMTRATAGSSLVQPPLGMSTQKDLIQPEMSVQKDLIQPGMSVQKDLIQQGMIVQKDILQWGMSIQKEPSEPAGSRPAQGIPPPAVTNKNEEDQSENQSAKVPRPAAKKEVNVKPYVLNRGEYLSFDQIDSIAKDCIDILSDAEEFVSPQRIEQLLLKRFSRNNLRELNVNLRHIDQLKCINEHVRLLNKVNLYVHAFVKCRCICSVHELLQCMKEFAQDDSDFKSLRLGPIQKLPVVYDLFKFPAEAEVLEITTIDILEHLRKYMDVKQKWMERLDLEDVMQYMVEQYAVDSAYELGVRIRSLPLSVHMIKKSQRDAAATRRGVTESCKEELKKEITNAFQKFRNSFFERGDDGKSEVRPHYLKQGPEVVIADIFVKFQLLISIEEPSDRTERKRQSRMKEAITNFITQVRSDNIAKLLFHLAVCVSNTVLQESAMEILNPPAAKAPESAAGETTAVRQPPAKGEILERLKKYLDNCLASGSLSLMHLERIEEKLLEDFCFTTFHAFGFGSFLRFLLGDPSAKHLLDECGGTTFGSSSGSHDGDSIYRPQITSLLEFIRQSKNAGISQLELIEGALKSQFSTTDVKHLGHGNIHRLVTAADKPGKHKAREYRVIYEAAVCYNSRCNTSQKRVGVLGNMTRDQALMCLHNCPLLADLEKFSHWSLVFEPEHGKLKDFIQKYGGMHTISLEGGQKTITTDIQALEVKPGKLLKLASQTSTEKFGAALALNDVIGTCGHLVSLVVSNKGLENMPLALMANHMKTALYKLHASSVIAQSPGAPPLNSSETDPAVCFVLACLTVLPLRICLAVADQVFLETLGQVIGSTKSKTSLLRACQTPQQQHKLEKLACVLGVQEWVDGIHDRCSPRHEDVTVVISAIEAEEIAEDLIMFPESESESESDSDDSISSILSDDESEDVANNDDEETVKAEGVADVDDVPVRTNEDVVEVSEEMNSDDEVTNEDVKEEEVMIVSSGDENENQETKDEDTVTVLTDSDEPSDNEEEKEEDEETETDICKKIVNEIRRNEFGIGIHLDSDGERLMKVQQERLGRSLDRLSKDLYSKDTHFVLELVQNADDNSYPEEMMQADSATCPTVKFIMDEQGVTVLNNESGFTESNVRALCDVGRSTKGKHKFGYIGQKGIGFKSVFRVTDRPEVHSNGYHICFDVKSGPTGYILPHWLDDAEQLDESWVTKICLPLKPEMASQTRSLAARFNDVHPSLLLFLHRLKQMIIENKIENSLLVMSRRDLGENIIEIEHNGKVDRFLVTKKMLDASNISLQAKSGIEVESTEIAIAFPLKSKDHKLHSQALPPKQPVFAFLPLRSYGFRFIIQGDFDVPSSREDVDRDSPWNQWLRNEIHVLFIEALEKFKSLEEFTELEALMTFLQFVPLEDEILDFFRPVSSSILQKLKAKECLPVQTSKKGSILWKIPSQTVIVRDPLIKEVISPELLQKNLNLYYLHEDLAQVLNLSLAQSLGLEQITVEHLLNIGKTLSQSWDGTYDQPDQVTVIAKWLACLYRSLDEFHENTAVFDSLKTMKIVPLSTGKLISLDETTVFLPPGDRSAEKKGTTGGKDLLGRLQQDLSMVHSGLITTSDNEVNSQVLKLLQRAGVKQLSPFDIVHHHILPILKSEEWQNKSRETLVCYLIYIKEQLSRQSGLINMSELKGVARVATNHGMKNPDSDAVHFTTVFGNDIDLPRFLPGYNWVLLDSVYLAGCNPLGVKQWHDFFVQLGVTDFLSIKPVSVHLTKTDMANSAWAPLETVWPESEDGYYIEDFACEEFHSLVTCNLCPDNIEQQMRVLFDKLSRRWDTQFSAYSTVQVKNKSGSVLRPTEDSSFSIYLRTLKWVPAIQLALETTPLGLKLVKTLTLMQPSVLYVNSPKLQTILSHMVMYLEPTDITPSFALFLRIKTNVEVKTVKELLIESGARSDNNGDDGDKTAPAIFKTCMSHVKSIYQYLNDNLGQKELQDLFHEHPVIFIPENNTPPDMFVPGKMLGRDELWWVDQTGLFLSYRRSLVDCHSALANKFIVRHLYLDCEDMFLRGVRLQRFPSLSEYAQLMVHITSVLSPSETNALDDVLNIFRLIGLSILDQDTSAEPSVQSMSHKLEVDKVLKILKKQKFLPTKKDMWVAVDDKPMISNNKELEGFFIDKPDVHLLQLAEKAVKGKGRIASQKDAERKLEKTMAFVNLFKIPQLTDCVVINKVTEMMEPCPKVQKYMHKVTSFIQAFLYMEFSDIYQQLITELDIVHGLTEISFWKVGKLEVTYSLKDKDFVPVIRQEKCVMEDERFYFHKSHTDSFPDINREIARYFSCGNEKCMKDLRSFLSELSSVVDDKRGTNELLSRRDIDDIPDDEVTWEVPAPVEAPPPVVKPIPIPEVPPSDNSDSHGETRGPAGLTSWPPQASVVAGPRRDGEKAPVSKMWPPPKPQDYQKDFQDLPSHIKIDRPASQQASTGERGEPGEATREHSQDIKRQHSSEEGRIRPERQESATGDATGTHGNKEDLGAGKRKLGEPEMDRQSKRSAQEGGDHYTGDRQSGGPSNIHSAVPGSKDSGGPGFKEPGAPQPQVTDKDDGNKREAPADGERTEASPIPASNKRGPPESDTELGISPKRPVYFRDPVWTESDSELIYEELGSGSTLKLPEMPVQSDADKPTMQVIGRWGEHLVHNYLLQQREVNLDITRIVWVNEAEESGLPYDFEIVIIDGEDEKSVFVEVKSTLLDTKQQFAISAREIQFAIKHKDAYQIYRIFNAGKDDHVKLLRIDNVAQKMEQGTVKLFMFI